MPGSHPAEYGFAGDFLRSDDRRATYAAASGILSALPAAVAIPRDDADVSALLRWASASGTPLIPRGAATGMPGGNVGPYVIIDLVTNFRAAPRVHAPNETAAVRPGVTLAELNEAAAPFDLHFPVDPSSGQRCTLGGMIANNSAGAHSVRYGATRRWIESLDIIFADGSRETLARGAERSPHMQRRLRSLDAKLQGHAGTVKRKWPNVRKNSSGYALREYLDSGDPVDLLVGSEGTLGIVTGATVKLTSRLESVGLVVLEFESLDSATEAVQRLLPLGPSTCELLDRTFLDLIRTAGSDFRYPLRPGIEALLLVEITESDAETRDEKIGTLERETTSIASRVVTAVEPQVIEELWEIRRAASPIIAREAGRRVSMQFIEDSVVPVNRLPQYILGLRSILERHELPAVIFGHAGDGNLHVNPLVDVSAQAWRQTIRDVLLETAELTISLGGTLAGEHGDGRLRAPLLRQVWGLEIFSAFEAVKAAFDPKGILNPGVILPLPGQTPFDLLKTYP